MRTIDDQWQIYAKQILPAAAGQTQRTETKRAFYSGAQAVLLLMADIANDDVSDEAGAAVLEGLHDEMRRFVDEVTAGRA